MAYTVCPCAVNVTIALSFVSALRVRHATTHNFQRGLQEQSAPSERDPKLLTSTALPTSPGDACQTPWVKIQHAAHEQGHTADAAVPRAMAGTSSPLGSLKVFCSLFAGVVDKHRARRGT